MSRKVALVTGAGKRRVGNAVARALAARGYSIALHYHTSAAAAENGRGTAGGREPMRRSFRRTWPTSGAVAALFEQLMERFGRLDALVTAGRRVGTAAPWRRPPRPTSAASLRSTRWARSSAASRPGGSWPASPKAARSLPSATGLAERPGTDYAAYYISKGALPTMTRMLAVELGPAEPAGPRELHPARPGDGCPKTPRSRTSPAQWPARS